ncbi:MAG: tetratricopeptide repeat protein [Magnetococcales bacterium]|nr:tetratricopeptide repeat protein [Magnetococcales bacterium]NGZ05911.1 tetratricopeptide repeat protein [Magnetococcales bacterium]
MRTWTAWLLACTLAGCLSRSGPERPPLQAQGLLSQEKARALWHACKVGQSVQESEHTLYLAQLRDDRTAMATALLELGHGHLALGELTLAFERYMQAEGRFLRLQDEYGLFQVAVGQARLLLAQGRHAQAEARFESLLSRVAFVPEEKEAWRATLYNGLAMARRGAGAYRLALEDLNQAEQWAAAGGVRLELASVWMNRARIHWDQKQHQAAREAVHRALALDRELENVPGTAADLVMLAAIAEAEGQMRETRELLQQAADLFDYCGLSAQHAATLMRVRQLIGP